MDEKKRDLKAENRILRDQEAAKHNRRYEVLKLVDNIIPPIEMINPVENEARQNGRKILAMHIMECQNAGLVVTLNEAALGKRAVIRYLDADALFPGFYFAQLIDPATEDADEPVGIVQLIRYPEGKRVQPFAVFRLGHEYEYGVEDFRFVSRVPMPLGFKLAEGSEAWPEYHPIQPGRG